jgi:hypothetical protein
MAYEISKESMQMIFYAIIIILVSVVLIFGGALFFREDVYVEDLENSLVVSRLLYSENCLANDNFGFIRSVDINEEIVSSCTGLDDNSKQGVRLRLYDYEDNLVKEVEVNKALTSQCLIENLGYIKKNYKCSYSKHYVLYDDTNGILEVMIVNEI